MLSQNQLHNYQHRSAEFIIEKKRCQLFLDMGLGKTVSTLTAMATLLDSFSVCRVLIIAPLRVANTVWKQEAKKWEHTQHLQIKIATGTPSNRISALMSLADIIVINRENVKWLVEFYGDRWPFDAVVIDESSSFKAHSTKRFKALKKILPKTHYMVLLTGTPAPNGIMDLWAQSFLINSGATLGRNITAYRNRYFDEDYMGYTYTPKKHAKAAVEALIAPYTLSMQAKDYLELPKRMDITIPVEMPPAELAKYKAFEKDLLINLDGEDVEALTSAVLANKLLQFANGAVYTDDLKNYATVYDGKLDALQDILDDNPNENVLLAYNYKSDLKRILERFPHAVVLTKDGKQIEEWNRGNIRLMVCHPASAGHGLNLQGGAATMVWFGLNWSLELYQQFCARLHRQGQTRPVRIFHLVATSTIDERVMSVLDDKDVVQSSLLKALNKKFV